MKQVDEKDQNMEIINCAAIPHNLLESEAVWI